MDFEIVSPILGFENIKDISMNKIDDIFANITSSNGIQWSLVNPYALRDYSISLPIYSQILLDYNSNCELEVYCMMILQKPLEHSKVNFLAPMVFNITNKKALQLYCSADEYPDLVKLETLQYFTR